MTSQLNDFEQKIFQTTGKNLSCQSLNTFQINVGIRCNQTCSHCHHDASPFRQEMMDWTTMKQILAITKQYSNAFIDITGGAPELHPQLQEFIQNLRTQHHMVQVRTNLTLLSTPEMKKLITFFKKNNVHLVAS